MAPWSVFLLLLPSLLPQSQASPARFPQRDVSSASTASGSDSFSSPWQWAAIPSSAPYLTPGNSSSTSPPYQPSSSRASSVPAPSSQSTSRRPRVSISSSSASRARSSGPSSSSSIPAKAGASSSSSIPRTSASSITGNGASSSSSTPRGTRRSSSSSIPLTPSTGSSSIPVKTGESSSSSIPGSGAKSSSSSIPRPSASASSSIPHGTGTSFSSSTSVGVGVSASSSVSYPTGISTFSSTPLRTSASSSSASLGAVSSTTGGSFSSPASAAPYSGTWSATPTLPTEAFPSYEAPTTTITGAAATSQAANLSGLFFALYANRQYITDPERKAEYVNDVKKTQDETLALFHSLSVQPPADPACSHTKIKRSLISGLTDLIGDVSKLISCATEVVGNLVNAVEASEPSLPEIELLTDTLNDIGQDLQNAEKNPTNSPSQSEASSTRASSSCTASTAVPRCTETISLSTSFFSGATVSSTVETITTTACTTITACDASATTTTTTVSTSTSSGGIVCATDCAACSSPIPTTKARRGQPLEERTLPDPDWFDSKDQYVMDQIESFDGVKIELEHRHSGKLSSAVTSSWLTTPEKLYVTGLFGCTSVVIISEAGVWFSHFWESPSFEGDDAQFESQVIDAIKSGDGPKMPSPFPLAADGQILNPANNVEIYISTPKDPNTGQFLYSDRVALIESTLTGDGAPWKGVPVTIRGYLKPIDERQEQAFMLRANSKVLIEYDNNQEPEEGEEPNPVQQAIYRVWLEQQMYQHEWDAKDSQKGASCANTGNQKRQAGGSCSQPAVSTGTSVAVPGASTGSTRSPSGSRGASVPGSSSALSGSSSTGHATTTITPQPTSSGASIPGSSSAPSSSSSVRHTITTTSRATPTKTSSTPVTVTPFTTTQSNGEVVSCASYTYYNNHVQCAGLRPRAIESAASAASASSASAASAASAAAEASAVWAIEAAVPSASCQILEDDGFGDSVFEVYGINGWAGNGVELFVQEKGCGLISGYEFHTDGEAEFKGVMRNTQYAFFGLSFFKGGCVERAVHSAGGPEPGNGPFQIACQHGPPEGLNETQRNAVTRVRGAQVKLVEAVANGTLPADQESVRTNGENASQPDPELVASARAALPHLLQQASSTPTPSPSS
ncbi:Uncharacterized protein T310_7252 [Rasamsonia emersonii CBS 393.64]|uniref:Uncharacterized protein n=1 Tax=Rasamsonia emersonii (strain ATCC 16479 / CBS 393.64 / IMI 116815) TaxID=1408163 RepID=A0A0F4YL06_RASE3|nr:Uncharacterized protein T310_7252 [Rasamsonia emersonii CBS 393.64]KKA18785.1 Uncharacterized protein T310_7252 [Rasamsonia emersonii CBS 393.64]